MLKNDLNTGVFTLDDSALPNVKTLVDLEEDLLRKLSAEEVREMLVSTSRNDFIKSTMEDNNVITWHSKSTAQLNVTGMLVPKFTFMERWVPGEVLSMETLQHAISELEDSEKLKNLVVTFSSPGGNQQLIGETRDKLKELASKCDLAVAYTPDIMASGAYWLATALPIIYASQYALIGSIGGYTEASSFLRMRQEAGIDTVIRRSGKRKALPHPFEKITKEGEVVLTEFVNETIEGFFNSVRDTRNPTGDWDSGQSFIASRALKLNLIDRITTYKDILSALTG